MKIVFYDNFVYYCNKAGKSPSAAAIDMGFQKSAVTRWKKNQSVPTAANQQRIAAYFGISIDELMHPKDNGLFDAPSANRQEVLENMRGLSDTEVEKVIEYICFLKSQQEKGE